MGKESSRRDRPHRGVIEEDEDAETYLFSTSRDRSIGGAFRKVCRGRQNRSVSDLFGSSQNDLRLLAYALWVCFVI